MGKTIACVIARAASTRLPLKVLRLMDEEHNMLDFIIQRLKMVPEIDEVWLCTSDEPVDGIMEDVAFLNGVKCYRGSADQPIARMIAVGEENDADVLLRVTGDDVFTAYEYIGEQIRLLRENNLDYIRVTGVPLGSSAEVMTLSALKDCYNKIDPDVSEYLTIFIYDPDAYKCGVIELDRKDTADISLSVDRQEDLDRTRTILNHYQGKDKLKINTDEIVEIIEKYNVPDSYFLAGPVKLPYGKVITYGEWLDEMKEKKAKSMIFRI